MNPTLGILYRLIEALREHRDLTINTPCREDFDYNSCKRCSDFNSCLSEFNLDHSLEVLTDDTRKAIKKESEK